VSRDAANCARELRRMYGTRHFVRSHARNLLSIARLTIARSLVFDASCRRIGIAQISLSLRGGFRAVSFPIFLGAP